MTRAEILDCLTDRPCDVCKFHESGKCERWDCVFEEKSDDAEPCEDKRMTREEAIKALKYERKTALHENKSAFDMAIKSLSAEPCEDAISRAEAIEAIAKADCTDGTKAVFCGRFIVELLKGLPSVTPKQKMGQWLKVDDDEPIAYDCSECEAMVSRRYRFCPNCGAKMEEGED